MEYFIYALIGIGFGIQSYSEDEDLFIAIALGLVWPTKIGSLLKAL